MPENVCCSCMGNCGEGATIPDWPMLMSPTLRIEPFTVAGGPTTPALGVIIPLRKCTNPRTASQRGEGRGRRVVADVRFVDAPPMLERFSLRPPLGQDQHGRNHHHVAER